MKGWYKNYSEVVLKDGTTEDFCRLIFETDNDILVKRIENFFYSIMDDNDTPDKIKGRWIPIINPGNKNYEMYQCSLCGFLSKITAERCAYCYNEMERE